MRFTDVSQLGKPEGLRALALDHAGPPLGIALPVLAFGLGVFAMGVLWASVSRQALFDRFSPMLSARLGRTQDPPDQAPASAGQAAAVPAPGSMLPDDLRPAGEGVGPEWGGTGWERPGRRPDPGDPPVSPGADRPPEHVKWAPPDGPG